MFIQPYPQDINKPIKWKDNQWFWCGKATQGHCERFRRHRGKECLGITKPNTSQKPFSPQHKQHNKEPKHFKPKTHNQNSKRTMAKRDPEPKKIRLSQALEAIHDNNMYDEEPFTYE